MKKFFSFCLIVTLILSACNSMQEKEENVLILENQLLLDDVQLIGHDSLYARKILDQKTFYNLLPHHLNEIEGNNWADQGFIYIGTLESSACPKKIKEISFDEKSFLVNLQLEKQSDHCTDDAVTKIFLVQINSDIIEKAKKIKLGETLASFQDGIAEKIKSDKK